MKYNPGFHKPYTLSKVHHTLPWRRRIHQDYLKISFLSCIDPKMRSSSLDDRIGLTSAWTARQTKRIPRSFDKEKEEQWRTDATLVWFANINPLTRWFDWTYGDLRVNATWIDAGPQGMKFANWRSRIRSRDWCTYGQESPLSYKEHERKRKRPTSVGSTSPWMILRMEI